MKNYFVSDVENRIIVQLKKYLKKKVCIFKEISFTNIRFFLMIFFLLVVAPKRKNRVVERIVTSIPTE